MLRLEPNELGETFVVLSTDTEAGAVRPMVALSPLQAHELFQALAAELRVDGGPCLCRCRLCGGKVSHV